MAQSNLCWHPGFVWWERKIRKLAQCTAQKLNMRYLDVLSMFDKRITAIELFPYHSKSFNAFRGFEEPPSVRAAKEFVASVLVSRYQRKEILLIVTRQAKGWGIGPKQAVGL
jgi:hypothetical protein